MSRRILVSLVTAAVLLPAGHARAEPPPPADLVLVGGPVYTVDASRSWARGVAVRDGRVVAVGPESDVQPLIGPDTRVIDLDGRLLLPGFHDSHIHPVSGGYTLLGCSLLEATSMEEIFDTLEACDERSPKGWLEATGYDQAIFPPSGPHKAMLDERFPDRPVYTEGSDGHVGWVNSRALEIAGIDRDTPDPKGGRIERDPETGEATGVLWDTAMDLFGPYRPERTPESDVEALRAALDHLSALGITSMAAIVYKHSEWAAYSTLAERGELSMRVVISLVYGPYAEYPTEDFEAAFAGRGQYASERVRNDSVKLFLDGVLEGESAALLEPYDVDSPHSGELNFEPEELNGLVTRFDAMGLQVHMHAIGDRAVRAGLDAVEAAQAANGRSDNRHHITHLQLINPDDVPRFGTLGVTANFQALWAYPDAWIMELNLPVVGMERVQRMYPIGSVLATGGRIAGSSDWDVSSANPLLAMETAIRRQDVALAEGPVLNADERVDPGTMIEAYTINGAWLMHHEDEVGSIQPGKRADLVVLDRNVFTVPKTEIGDAQVLYTLLDGEVVYAARPDEN